MQIHAASLAKSARANGVELMYLFGSAARGDMHQGSDVDIAVRSQKPLTLPRRLRIEQLVRRALGGEKRDIDLVDLRHVNPELGIHIAEEGKKLFGTGLADDAFHRLAIKRFVDARMIRDADEEDLQAYAAR